ncbi:DUF3801 domain-containing protein [Lachnospiraceae bacterium 48-33]
MDDISGAAQILEVTINGMTMAGRATIETAKIIQRMLLLSTSFFKFIATAPFKSRKYLKYRKVRGKTNIDNLKQKGGTIEMFVFSKEAYDLFEKQAFKWGILYHKNPRFDRKKFEDNGKVYISFPAEQAPMMEKLVEYIKSVTIREKTKKAEKEADDLSLKGKERKDFVTSLVAAEKNKFDLSNHIAHFDEYCKNSGIQDCDDVTYNTEMQNCYGNYYIEARAEIVNRADVKKKDAVAGLKLFENSKIEEKEKRIRDGAQIIQILEDDIVDFNKDENAIKCKTGIKDIEGKDIFLWVKLKDLYSDKEKIHIAVMDKDSEVILTNFREDKKMIMDGKSLMESLNKYKEEKPELENKEKAKLKKVSEQKPVKR